MSFFDPLNYGSGDGAKGSAKVGFFTTDHAPPFADKPMEAMMVFLSHVRSVGVAYLLALSFGPVGAHRFYLRKIKTGAIMALLALVSVVVLASHDGARFWFPRDLGYVLAPLCLGIWLILDLVFLPEAVRLFNRGLRDRIISGRGA